MNKNTCSHQDLQFYHVKKGKPFCYACAYDQRLNHDDMISMIEYHALFKGNAGESTIRKLFSCGVLPTNPLMYKNRINEDSSRDIQQYIKFITELQRKDNPGSVRAISEIHKAYDEFQQLVLKALDSMRKKDCLQAEKTSADIIDIVGVDGHPIRLSYVSKTYWSQNVKPKTAEQISLALKDKLIKLRKKQERTEQDKIDNLIAMAEKINPEFITKEAMKADILQQFKICMKEIRKGLYDFPQELQSDMESRALKKNYDIDNASIEDIIEMFTTAEHRNINKRFRTMQKSFIFKENTCIQIEREVEREFTTYENIARIKCCRDFEVVKKEDWFAESMGDGVNVDVDAYALPFVVMNDVFELFFSANKSCFESMRGFYADTVVNGDYSYDNTLNGMHKPMRGVDRFDVCLPLVDGIPHGRIRKHDLNSNKIPFTWLEDDSLDIIEYKFCSLDGAFNNGLFYGKVDLEVYGDYDVCKTVFEGYVFANVAYEGTLTIREDVIVLREFLIVEY